MKVGEFFVELGVDADNPSLKEFAKGLVDLPLEAAGAIAALGAVTLELKSLAKEALEAAVGFQLFENETGLSSQQLQKWQIVAEQANVSASAVGTSIMALQRNIAEIRLGRGNISPFQLLGIDPRQDPFAILDQLRDRIKGLDRGTAVNLMAQMGLDPSMINILSMTNEQFRQLENTSVRMTSSQEKAFLKVKLGLTQLTQAVRGLAYTLFEILAPIAEHLTNDLITIANWVGKLIGLFEQFAHTLARIPGNVAAIVLALSPLLTLFSPITLAIVGLLLVLDDLATYFRGGDSVTGDAIKGLQELGKQFADTMTKFPKTAAWVTTVGSMLAGAPQPSAATMQRITNVGGVSITVQSNGSPDEVAKKTKSEFDQATSDAALQTDNQGY